MGTLRRGRLTESQPCPDESPLSHDCSHFIKKPSPVPRDRYDLAKNMEQHLVVCASQC